MCLTKLRLFLHRALTSLLDLNLSRRRSLLQPKRYTATTLVIGFGPLHGRHDRDGPEFGRRAGVSAPRDGEPDQGHHQHARRGVLQEEVLQVTNEGRNKAPDFDQIPKLLEKVNSINSL